MSGVRAAIRHVSSYVPEGKRTNEELAAQAEGWTPEKIGDKTGIRVRNVAAEDEFTSDMACSAAEALFEATGVDRADVDFVILVTVSPDQLLPFTASTIQDRLGLPTSCGALDVTLACSGYPYALALAGGLVESGRATRVLLLTGDRFTSYVDEAEMGSKTLFGDAATATLVEAVDAVAPSGGVIGRTRYGTDGSGAHHLIIPTAGMKGFVGAVESGTSRPTFQMNGSEVFDFTLRVIGKFVKDFLAECELTVEQVDHFVFHQANRFMLEHLRRRLRVPEERFVHFIETVGNTSSSTIPLALADLYAHDRLGAGRTAVLVGFGTGYSWSAARVDWV